MTADEITRLISAIAQMIGVVVWPAALVFFFVYFRGGLRSFIANLGEFNVKTPAIEATAKRRVEAAAALGAAQAQRASAGAAHDEPLDPQDIAEALPGPRVQRAIQGSRVLWVDDRPDNNLFERSALEALGIKVDLSNSTDEAIRQLRRRPYDLIISDMGRPPNPRAGYTLLDDIRECGDSTPFVIYASSRAPEHVREVRQHGAIGATNSPRELVSMVTRTLAASRTRPTTW
ncbi:MAG TPA: response regulator [Streptosporangiaceae bacterium]|nr:response regulator [Streptosporangiaceae bacterium]